ncbi:hypothetical protein T01_10953 [Trichinella spiralis]|uniref:Uncharacterized protein n=1 Tax=Trichinella spiralis TaxID=6334 RepID=A0A0V1BSW3_TRISP|nr:hypothetical protein T01_10953 [Trichinella spiralis]
MSQKMMVKIPPATSETATITERHDIHLWCHKYCDKKFFMVYTAALKSLKELKQASQRTTTTADIPVSYKSNGNRHRRAILTDRTGKKAHLDDRRLIFKMARSILHTGHESGYQRKDTQIIFDQCWCAVKCQLPIAKCFLSNTEIAVLCGRNFHFLRPKIT